MKSEKVKNIMIVCLIVLVIILLGFALYFAFFKRNVQVIQGTVIIVGDGYVILEGDTDYVLETEEDYELGDVLEIKSKDIDESVVPIIIKKGEVSLKEKANDNSFFEGNFEITQDENMNSNIFHSDEKRDFFSTDDHNTINDNEEANSATNDEIVLAYLNEVEVSENNENVLKNGFVTVVDFLFYNGTIKGISLNQITSKTKLAVLKVALSLDQKMNQFFPDYKEKISSTTNRIYTGIKEKVLILYFNTTVQICSNNPTLCSDAKRDFQSMKSSFGISWDLLKSLVEAGVGNLKDWYEIYSGK